MLEAGIGASFFCSLKCAGIAVIEQWLQVDDPVWKVFRADS